MYSKERQGGKEGGKHKHGPKDSSMRPMYTFYYAVLQVVQVVVFYGLPQMLLGTTSTWSSILKEFQSRIVQFPTPSVGLISEQKCSRARLEEGGPCAASRPRVRSRRAASAIASGSSSPHAPSRPLWPLSQRSTLRRDKQRPRQRPMWMG